MTDAKPFPKSQQLARGQKRYRRKVASPSAWAKIVDAKIGPCRVCCDPCSNGKLYGRVQFHHIVPRAQGGDDVPDNIAPVCSDCHWRLTQRQSVPCRAFVSRLTDAEYAYAVTKLGEAVFERVYGIEYER